MFMPLLNLLYNMHCKFPYNPRISYYIILILVLMVLRFFLVFFFPSVFLFGFQENCIYMREENFKNLYLCFLAQYPFLSNVFSLVKHVFIVCFVLFVSLIPHMFLIVCTMQKYLQGWIDKRRNIWWVLFLKKKIFFFVSFSFHFSS